MGYVEVIAFATYSDLTGAMENGKTAMTYVCNKNHVLYPSPIRYEWIIEGESDARSAIISTSADSQSFTVIWECSPGIFRWHYSYDETIHFMEGSVTFDDDRGTTWTVGPGDVVYFPKGSSVIWNVHTRVRKLAVCRKTLPKPIAAVIGALRRLKAAFSQTKDLVTFAFPALLHLLG
jgi:uncharacterized cupin superfamily protein